MKILFIFIDGLGIGKNDPLTNPCAHPEIRFFNNFLDEIFPKKLHLDGFVIPIDAQLDVPGLPQSATGQTALYTGLNAAKILGKHLSGFPNQKLRQLLTEASILKRVTQLGKKAAFINAYRPIFFERGPEALIRFLSVTSIMNWKAGLKFFDFDDLKNQRCIYHDFTNQELIRKEFEVPEISAQTAGKILADASTRFDFCLYEYFKTDRAGHAQELIPAGLLLQQIEEFISTILSVIDLSATLVIVTSDHGNIEDLSKKTHTANPVPLLVWGVKKSTLIKEVNSILDLTLVLLKLLSDS